MADAAPWESSSGIITTRLAAVHAARPGATSVDRLAPADNDAANHLDVHHQSNHGEGNRKAAGRGERVSNYGLTAAYANGKGVRRDLFQALVHLLNAWQSGYPPLDQWGALRSALTPEQIAEAEKATAEWRPASET